MSRIFFPPPLHTAPHPCYNGNRRKGEGGVSYDRSECDPRIEASPSILLRPCQTYMLPDGTYRRPQDPAEAFPD